MPASVSPTTRIGLEDQVLARQVAVRQQARRDEGLVEEGSAGAPQQRAIEVEERSGAVAAMSRR